MGFLLDFHNESSSGLMEPSLPELTTQSLLELREELLPESLRRIRWDRAPNCFHAAFATVVQLLLLWVKTITPLQSSRIPHKMTWRAEFGLRAASLTHATFSFHPDPGRLGFGPLTEPSLAPSFDTF